MTPFASTNVHSTSRVSPDNSISTSWIASSSLQDEYGIRYKKIATPMDTIKKAIATSNTPMDKYVILLHLLLHETIPLYVCLQTAIQFLCFLYTIHFNTAGIVLNSV